jgi:hypothetical protein
MRANLNVSLGRGCHERVKVMATKAESVEQQLARLTAENEMLRAEVAMTTKRKRFSGRLFGAAVFILIGALISPTALIVSWANAEFTNTDRFVATFAPLADDPAVQALLIDKITTVIDEKVDIDQATSDLFDGLAQLDLPPRAIKALSLLEGPAAQGVRSLVDTATTKVIQSDAFASIWEQSLRVTHSQLIGVLEGTQSQVLNISDSGEVGIALGPIVAAVADQLVENGVGLGALIPEVTTVIPLGQFDAIVQARAAYALFDVLSWLIPLVALLFIATGVLLARDRRRAGIHASIAVAIMMVILASGIAIGRTVFVISIAPYLTSGSSSAIYDAVVPFVASVAITIAVIATVIALVLYLFGPAPRAVRFRGFVVATAAKARKSMGSGRAGDSAEAEAEAAAELVTTGAPAAAPATTAAAKAPATTSATKAPAKATAAKAPAKPAAATKPAASKPAAKPTTKPSAKS